MKTETAKHHAELKHVVRRAIIVLDALGDPELRFMALGRSIMDEQRLQEYAAEDKSIIAYNQPNYVKYIPTAQEIARAETVEGWLIWLAKLEGRDSTRRLVAWAHSDPIWRIADRERCTERAITYRIDKSIAAMLKEFRAAFLEMLPHLSRSLEDRRCIAAEAVAPHVAAARGRSFFLAERAGADNDNSTSINPYRKLVYADGRLRRNGKEARDSLDRYPSLSGWQYVS